MPEEVLEVRLMERFGWTLAELDEADEARLFPALSAANLADAARAVRAWMDAAGSGRKVEQPSKATWQMWKTVQDAKRSKG